ncbi:hypothetical protein R1sor_002729 [Riccia sorocarpa]|uniref:Integrator complex subunit 6-like beta-barrel domain-containing protein n=1 Tax=Riccia sorocarpa TaxID=122646 RepID=A0ABD3GZM7_9MARC
MNQRCANGLTLLDCAKSAVEHFHKVRSRDQSCRMDRYMLVTCEDGPDAIKAVDKYPFTHFMRALKSVQARDLTNIGAAMQRIFTFLHVQRLSVDIDRFGQGRNPCSIDPTTIMLLTDGTELTSLAGVTQNLVVPGLQAGVSQNLLLPGPNPVGFDLSSQPFRWDQRVFATVLRIPSVSTAVLERSGPIPQNAPISGSQIAVQMDNTISAFCEFTGGKCFVATSWKVLMQHTEVTAARLPPCVIVSFEHMPLPGSVNLPPQVHAACQRKMLYVRGGQAQQGHWPIPEAFWPDPSQQGIPARDSHPTIAYKAVDADPSIPPNFTCDKYEIESNPIVGFLLKAPAGVCWQVFVRNSKGTNHGYGDPFGYLRLNRGGTTLTLVILPYNYPVLWQLLEQVSKTPGSTKIPPLPQWRQDMERYCSSIPAYYGAPLRTALKRWGLSAHVVPDSMENSLVSGFVGTQLKRMKMQAKQELDEDMKRILTEQQMLSVNPSLNMPQNYQSRVLPPVSSANNEAPPGFNSGGSNGAGNNTASTTPVPANQQCRGVGHGDQLGARKGWEALIPSGPSSSGGVLGSTSTGPFVNQGVQNMPAYGSNIGIQNNDSVAASNIGVMKDIPLFKNPFDVPRDQLLRQLRYLPIRIAVAMETRQSRRVDNGKGKSSAVSLLAARLAAKEEDEARHSLPIEKMGDFNEALMKQQPPRNPFAEDQDRSKQQRTMFGNPYRQEKNDGADEAWMEGPGGPIFRGRKRRRRQESPSSSTSSLSTSGSAVDTNSEAASGNAEVTSPVRNLPESQSVTPDGLRTSPTSAGTKVNERVSDAHDAVLPAENRGVSVADMEMGEDSIEGKKVQGTLTGVKQTVAALLDFQGSPSERMDTTSSGDMLSGLEKLRSSSQQAPRFMRKRRVVYITPLGTEKDRDEVISFLLNIVKALRYSKPSNTQKLFELLSSPDFPVDKSNFLEQLILQAERYNKVSVAKELVDYRNQLTSSAAVVSEKS